MGGGFGTTGTMGGYGSVGMGNNSLAVFGSTPTTGFGAPNSNPFGAPSGSASFSSTPANPFLGSGTSGGFF